MIEQLSSTANSSIPEISVAFAKSKKIYEIYKKRFLNRILLSDFSRRDHKDLGNHAQLYNKLKDDFDVLDSKINEEHLCSIELTFRDSKGKKNSGVSKIELRLLVLLLSTKIWIDHRISRSDKSEILPLTKEDYFYVLNPIVNTTKGNNPLTLLMHSEISESDYTEAFGKWLYDKSSKEIPRANWNEFNQWINFGEKKIIESFYQLELSKIKSRPDWL